MKKSFIVILSVFFMGMSVMAAQAQTFAGTVKHMTVSVGTINAQTGKYTQQNVVIPAMGDTGNFVITLNDLGNGYATVVGDLELMLENNASLHFSGNLLSPAPGKQYMGDVPVTGSFGTFIDDTGDTDTNTFSASGKVHIVVTKDNSGNITKGVISLKLSPYNETNSTAGNPEIMTFTIPATAITPQ